MLLRSSRPMYPAGLHKEVEDNFSKKNEGLKTNLEVERKDCNKLRGKSMKPKRGAWWDHLPGSSLLASVELVCFTHHTFKRTVVSLNSLPSNRGELCLSLLICYRCWRDMFDLHFTVTAPRDHRLPETWSRRCFHHKG